MVSKILQCFVAISKKWKFRSSHHRLLKDKWEFRRFMPGSEDWLTVKLDIIITLYIITSNYYEKFPSGGIEAGMFTR